MMTAKQPGKHKRVLLSERLNEKTLGGGGRGGRGRIKSKNVNTDGARQKYYVELSNGGESKRERIILFVFPVRVQLLKSETQQSKVREVVLIT